jgi:hypothetical protein
MTLAFASGLVSVALALAAQSALPPATIINKWTILYETFVRVALTEEASRLAVLAILLRILRPRVMPTLRDQLSQVDVGYEADADAAEAAAASRTAALGLLVGLIFALVETAMHGAASLDTALLRAVSASPLHGACGIRVALSAHYAARKVPAQAIQSLLFALTIHGVYNYIIIRPGFFFPLVAILVALTSFVSSARYLVAGAVRRDEEI